MSARGIVRIPRRTSSGRMSARAIVRIRRREARGEIVRSLCPRIRAEIDRACRLELVVPGTDRPRSPEMWAEGTDPPPFREPPAEVIDPPRSLEMWPAGTDPAPFPEIRAAGTDRLPSLEMWLAGTDPASSPERRAEESGQRRRETLAGETGRSLCPEKFIDPALVATAPRLPARSPVEIAPAVAMSSPGKAATDLGSMATSTDP
jgi:hypothetical protein